MKTFSAENNKKRSKFYTNIKEKFYANILYSFSGILMFFFIRWSIPKHVILFNCKI